MLSAHAEEPVPPGFGCAFEEKMKYQCVLLCMHGMGRLEKGDFTDKKSLNLSEPLESASVQRLWRTSMFPWGNLL